MTKFFNRKFFSLLIIVIVSSLIGFESATYFCKRQDNVSEKNKEAVIKLIEEVWSKNNLEIVDKLIAPQYTIRHDPGDQWEGKTLDLTTYKERVKKSRYVFPDQKFHIEDLVAEGNKVSVSWRFTGTQNGMIPGLPASNKKVTVSGITIYYLSKGKIIGHWQIVDRLGFLGQLGIKKN